MKVSNIIIILIILLVIVSQNTKEELTLREKIAQKIMMHGINENIEGIKELKIGGAYIGSEGSKGKFINLINNLQNQKIPLFIAADMEGCINPFNEFFISSSLKNIKTEKQAYELGKRHGQIMNELRFNINLAPVVDLNDTIWNCRSFSGDAKEISNFSYNYVKGLQEQDVIATLKHFPGKTISLKDPHNELVYATIEEEDLLPYKNTNAKAIMISHIIVNGSINSNSKPAVVSKELIKKLREELKFEGLIITDDIGMEGLKKYYDNKDQMYIDLFKADNDIILTFENVNEVKNMIYVVEKAIKEGIIEEKMIDKSVNRILKYKKQ